MTCTVLCVHSSTSMWTGVIMTSTWIRRDSQIWQPNRLFKNNLKLAGVTWCDESALHNIVNIKWCNIYFMRANSFLFLLSHSAWSSWAHSFCMLVYTSNSWVQSAHHFDLIVRQKIVPCYRKWSMPAQALKHDMGICMWKISYNALNPQ